jgi:mRNA interferase RelE/StbE
MYKIVITRRALKDLEKIDKKTKNFIGKKIKEYTQEDPLRHARKLVDPKIGTYRFRIGDYRVIFDIEDDTIVILRIGHRREIYK